MRRTRFDAEPCPIARATDLIGDWWTPLVLREVFSGKRRFEEFQSELQIPRAVLTARLKRLCDEGMLTKVECQQSPPRHEYRLTDKGRDFWDVLAAMFRWGSDWMWGEGGHAPVVLQDRRTGKVVRPQLVDEATGKKLDVRQIQIVRDAASAGATA